MSPDGGLSIFVVLLHCCLKSEMMLVFEVMVLEEAMQVMEWIVGIGVDTTIMLQ